MKIQELDKWWSHLTVATKEDLSGVSYPSCTVWWNSITQEQKRKVYTDAGGRDAHDHHKWKKGNTSLT